jgi:hypothetical protein
MKEIIIKAPDGYEIDKESSNSLQIVFKPVKQKAMTWEEIQELNILKNRKQYYLNGNEISDQIPNSLINSKDNVPSKHIAKKILALCQLYIIAEYYNDGWEADWSDPDQFKHYAYWGIKSNTMQFDTWAYVILNTPAFKSLKALQQAYEANREIFETALKP